MTKKWQIHTQENYKIFLKHTVFPIGCSPLFELHYSSRQHPLPHQVDRGSHRPVPLAQPSGINLYRYLLCIGKVIVVDALFVNNRRDRCTIIFYVFTYFILTYLQI